MTDRWKWSTYSVEDYHLPLCHTWANVYYTMLRMLYNNQTKLRPMEMMVLHIYGAHTLSIYALWKLHVVRRNTSQNARTQTRSRDRERAYSLITFRLFPHLYHSIDGWWEQKKGEAQIFGNTPRSRINESHSLRNTNDVANLTALQQMLGHNFMCWFPPISAWVNKCSLLNAFLIIIGNWVFREVSVLLHRPICDFVCLTTENVFFLFE